MFNSGWMDLFLAICLTEQQRIYKSIEKKLYASLRLIRVAYPAIIFLIFLLSVLANLSVNSLFLLNSPVKESPCKPSNSNVFLLINLVLIRPIIWLKQLVIYKGF